MKLIDFNFKLYQNYIEIEIVNLIVALELDLYQNHRQNLLESEFESSTIPVASSDELSLGTLVGQVSVESWGVAEAA